MFVNYVALIESGSDDTAFGVVFPDLPGCFSAGDTFDEAVKNASEALSLHCEVALEYGLELPASRSMDAVVRDQSLKEEFSDTIHRFVSVSAEVPVSVTYSQPESRQELVRPGFKESSD